SRTRDRARPSNPEKSHPTPRTRQNGARCQPSRARSSRVKVVLLSDRDIKAEIAAGRVGLDPLDIELVQPASIDVRLDHFFRLFHNHKYPFIDPAEDQPELTHLVEVDASEPFILHPGEFVL